MPGFRSVTYGQRRRLDGRLRGLQTRGPERPSRLLPPDGQQRRLGGNPAGVAGVVSAGGLAEVLFTRLAQYPQTRQARRQVRGVVGQGVAGVPRSESACFWAAIAAAVGLDRAAGESVVAGRAGQEGVWTGWGVRVGLP